MAVKGRSSFEHHRLHPSTIQVCEDPFRINRITESDHLGDAVKVWPTGLRSLVGCVQDWLVVSVAEQASGGIRRQGSRQNRNRYGGGLIVLGGNGGSPNHNGISMAPGGNESLVVGG